MGLLSKQIIEREIMKGALREAGRVIGKGGVRDIEGVIWMAASVLGIVDHPKAMEKLRDLSSQISIWPEVSTEARDLTRGEDVVPLSKAQGAQGTQEWDEKFKEWNESCHPTAREIMDTFMKRGDLAKNATALDFLLDFIEIEEHHEEFANFLNNLYDEGHWAVDSLRATKS